MPRGRGRPKTPWKKDLFLFGQIAELLKQRKSWREIDTTLKLGGGVAQACVARLSSHYEAQLVTTDPNTSAANGLSGEGIIIDTALQAMESLASVRKLFSREDPQGLGLFVSHSLVTNQ